jgi:molybdopterin/thiamine biosynthesis adenylyltransferase
MLSSDELERYARHIVLREVGGPGQAALKRARVLVIGPASARSASSTTTRWRFRTCSGR